MISYTTGNILDSPADCLINTVNCEGYMGKGIAYQFKLRFPENNRQYVKECKAGRLRPGKVFSFSEDGKIIINFPTKDKWREKSSLGYIDSGMETLVKELMRLNVKSAAIPPLGCGNGGLEWSEVKEIITKHITPLENDYDFSIYEPSTKYYKPCIKKAPSMSFSSLIIIDMKRRLSKFDKLRLQKTGYFLNYYLGKHYFKFDKGTYGPYSHSIEIVIKRIAEYQAYYNISDTNELYESVFRTIRSKKTDESIDSTTEALSKAISFVNTIETNHDLEGIATTLYLIEESPMTPDELWACFDDWGKSSRFQRQELSVYLNILQENGMIDVDLTGKYEVIYP